MSTALLGFALAILFPASAFADVIVYVAPNGNDNWSGRMPHPNPQKTDGPFATLYKARDAVRNYKDKENCQVNIQPGYYVLNETFILLAEDTPTTTTVTYQSASSERPILSGGEAITGWKVDSSGKWVADVPGTLNVAQLFVNGERRHVARTPNAGYLYWASPLEPCTSSANPRLFKSQQTVQALKDCPPGDNWGFVYNKSDINPNWTNLHDVKILLFHAWTATWHNIASVHADNHSVIFQQESRYAPGWNVAASGKRYIVTNVYEALDRPGEWYFNRATRQLAYFPMHGELPSNASVVVPRLDTIVHLKNATNVQFHGIEIRHATDGPGNRQFYRATTAAFQIEDSRDVLVTNTLVTVSGADGISIAGECSNIVIHSCSVSNVGGDGISMSEMSRHILINNSVVDSVGFYFLQQPAGIRVKGQDDIVVQHNEVSHVPYGGILVGWQPGFDDDRRADKNPVFVIQYNHVHDHGMQILSDYGGVYISALVDCWQPPIKSSCNMATLVYQNIIHDAVCYNYGGDGVYTDEAAAGVLVRSNLVYNLDATGVYFHCGVGNAATNNFLATTDRLGHRGAVGVCNTGGFDVKVAQEFTFFKNIVDVTTGNLMAGTDFLNASFHDNLYYNTSSPLVFPGKENFHQWQAQGQDAYSLVADPLFVSVKNHNFTLRSNSPALKLGIQQIDFATVGPQDNPFRQYWQ